MDIGLSLKIGISGVRGVVGDSLTPQLAARFAAAFGTYVGRGKVIVGRDARPSGEMLENAVFAGLLAVGCQPVAIGVCPIPSVLLLTKELRAQGGVVVTASHNPKEWNGLKFLSARGLYLKASEVEEFLDIYHQGEFSFVRADRHRAVLEEPHPTRHHLARLLRSLDAGLTRRKRIRVVADCANGAGSVLMPEFLEALGCETILLNATPDGTFAHQSEPVPENLAGLCRRVREAGADIGFAQDADADRLAVIDAEGRALGEEMTLALAVKHVLGRTPGPVVVNLSTTQAIDDLAAAAGVPVFRTKIGESNVVEEMLARRAAIGGEGNGGVVWPAVHPCRDSFAAAGLILEMLAASGKSVARLAGEIPAYAMVKDKVPGTPGEAHKLLGRLRKDYADEEVSTLDGLLIQTGGARVHIRPSNTEPVIRVQAEARTRREAAAALARVKRRMAALQR
ncbi:MAG TPA: phosphoglucosamine mutase [Terriglobales bacterium]|nr:phosphoglucosamine mutase [Terriglobales bacterium]